jgi:hypothetical protein
MTFQKEQKMKLGYNFFQIQKIQKKKLNSNK